MYCKILEKNEYINEYSSLWKHTKLRIDAAKEKSKTEEDFKKKMMTRLSRITHHDKLLYAIAYLQQNGYMDIADSYETRILIEKLANNWEE